MGSLATVGAIQPPVELPGVVHVRRECSTPGGLGPWLILYQDLYGDWREVTTVVALTWFAAHEAGMRLFPLLEEKSRLEAQRAIAPAVTGRRHQCNSMNEPPSKPSSSARVRSRA